MARGWESKSVESQMESAEARRAARNTPIDPAQAERNRKRESLQLTRTRILRDLEAAQNPRHREILLAGLKHLDEKISELN